MRTIIVSATRAASKDDTLLGKAVNEQYQYYGRTVELEMVCNNTDKLSAVYNRYITPEYKNCCIIFVHDDVTFNVSSTLFELEKALKVVNIVGLAGCTNAVIKRPALWHHMAERKNLSGAVAHPAYKDGNEVFMTSFGVYPLRCLLMDGLFLAVDINSLLATGVKFDETNPAIAHFYDLDFCLTANSKGLKMSTWPIYATHKSPGLLSINDPAWKTAEDWFIKKWANKV